MRLFSCSWTRVSSKALASAGLTIAGSVAIVAATAVSPPASTTQNESEVQNELLSAPKKVIVVGGGVVGVTAAYKLALAGHSVALLEPRSEPGQECSACAAGGMQKSNPTVDKETWIAVLKCIAPGLPWRSNHDFKFFHIDWGKTLSDPFFLRWVFNFTHTSLLPGPQQQEKQKDMLDFTKFAVEDMLKMMRNRRDVMASKSGWNPNGSLSLLYETPSATAESSEVAKVPSGSTSNPTSSKSALEPYFQVREKEIENLEPSIRFQEKQPTTAKYEFEASAASSERFTKELAERCSKDKSLDVEFLYNTKVTAIRVETPPSSKGTKPRITQLQTNRGPITVAADTEVVVAAGAWIPHILALMGLYAPVYPLKGYAMSVSAEEALKTNTELRKKDLPSRIVSDKYMYTSRLGDEIRITSIGEFSGWSTKPTPQVDVEFRNEAARQFPQLRHLIEKAATRCGHRPYVSDGILLLGRVDTHENLLVSCGPGSNGWKLAMGSGEVIERLVSGENEEQISKALGCNVASFSPTGRVVNAPFFAKVCRARWGV